MEKIRVCPVCGFVGYAEDAVKVVRCKECRYFKKDEALWNVGFDLDDWDICIESDTRLLRRVSDGRGSWWDEPLKEAYWLVSQMENYCCGYNEVEYNGKWYYTVHHA